MMILVDVFEQTMLMLPMIFGIYLSYRILKITELSVEASFVLGACVFAKSSQVQPLIIAVMLALLSGALVGSIVYFVHKKLEIPVLISGILIIFMFQSVNYVVMAQPNIQIIRTMDNNYIFRIYLLCNVMICMLTYFFLRSQYGLRLRSVGINNQLASKLGISAKLYYWLTVGVSNMLAAISGVTHAYYGGFADLHMGVGISLIGIAAIMIGISLLKLDQVNTFNLNKEISAIFAGVLLYSLVISMLLHFGCDPIYLKFVLGLIVFVALFSAGKTYQEVPDA